MSDIYSHTSPMFNPPPATVRIWLPYIAPNLNDLLEGKGEAALFARIRRVRKQNGQRYYPGQRPLRDGYHATKSQWNTRVNAHVRRLRIAPGQFPRGAHVWFHIVERDERRDPDNFCGGSTKLVLDGLVRSGILPTDSWKGVLSLSYTWDVSKRPGVLVTLSDARFTPMPEIGGAA
jgi:hypothetical protein